MHTTVIAGSGMGTERAAAAAFLAACWGERGDRVLAVDATRGGLLTALLLAPIGPGEGALADVLVRGYGLSEVGRPCGFDGVGVISGGPALAGLDFCLADAPDATLRLRRAIANLPPVWDRVVIDTAESPALTAANALVAADEVVVPVATGPSAIATLRDAEQAIGRVRAHGGNPELRLAGAVLVGGGGAERVRRAATLLEGRGTTVLGTVSRHASWAEWRVVAMRLGAGRAWATAPSAPLRQAA